MATKNSAASSSSTSPTPVKNQPEAKGAVPYEEANKGNLAIPPNTENPVAATAEAAAAAIATRSQHLTGESGNTAFDTRVGEREADVQTALQERAAILGDLDAQAKKEAERTDERSRTIEQEREYNREHVLDGSTTRVPVTDELRARHAAPGVTPAAGPTPAVGPGPAPVDRRLPGTGVADPRDLAPGQDISPSPPGGVSITPLPNKAGTPFSAL